MIPIGSDTLVSLEGHADNVSGAYINNATVSAAVLDGDTSLFSVSLAYVAGSNGNYRGVFTAANTSTLTPGKVYLIAYTATSALGTLVVHKSEAADYITS